MISRLRSYFFDAVPVETLGVFRIGIAGFAIIQLAFLSPDWLLFFGPEGLIPWDVSEVLSTTHTPSLKDVTSLFFISPYTSVYLVTILYVFSLAGLLIGFWSRTMGILAWLTHITLNTTGHFSAYGVETFTHISLFYCAVLPVGASLSLDHRRGKYNHVSSYLITLSVRMLQLHLCIVYFSTGLEKAMGEQWWNGEAIWMALQQDQFRQIDTGWLARVPWLPQLLGLGTLLFEIAYPFAIHWSRTKKIWLCGIAGMHVFIATFMGLYLFGGLMILLNIAAFGEHVFPGIFSQNRLMTSLRARLRVPTPLPDTYRD